MRDSRTSARSCRPTIPDILAITSKNRIAEPATATYSSRNASTAGAASDAAASRASRSGVSFGAVSGAGSETARIDGCNAAAPKKT